MAFWYRTVADRAEARHQLEGLVSHLRAFGSELENAKREGLWFLAERAQSEVRKLHQRIRRHCKKYGLPRPSDVPEAD
jgi:hypothetical protein